MTFGRRTSIFSRLGESLNSTSLGTLAHNTGLDSIIYLRGIQYAWVIGRVRIHDLRVLSRGYTIFPTGYGGFTVL